MKKKGDKAPGKVASDKGKKAAGPAKKGMKK